MNHHHHQPLHHIPTPQPFGGDHGVMNNYWSILPMEALMNNTHNNNNNNNNRLPAVAKLAGDTGFFEGNYNQPQHELEATFLGPAANIEDDFSFDFKHDYQQDVMNEHGGLGGSPPWHQQNFALSQQSCISAAVDSPYSICAGSPTSILTPKTGDNQGSGSSEDEDAEVEAGPNEQSNNPDDIKRLRRMESNRLSAARSRTRKQAQLHELETQVEALTGEYVTLFKQLGDAAQQLRLATTDNRILKSDVDALRAKVKLAEERVTRGTMSPTFNHLLQTHMSSSAQMLNPQALSRVLGVVPPTLGFQGQDNTSFGGAFSGIVGDHILNGNAESPGLMGSTTDAVSSCVDEMWPCV